MSGKPGQAPIAKIRNITIAQISALVARYTSGRGLGFLGEPTVNVVQLNLASTTPTPTDREEVVNKA